MFVALRQQTNKQTNVSYTFLLRRWRPKVVHLKEKLLKILLKYLILTYWMENYEESKFVNGGTDSLCIIDN